MMNSLLIKSEFSVQSDPVIDAHLSLSVSVELGHISGSRYRSRGGNQLPDRQGLHGNADSHHHSNKHLFCFNPSCFVQLLGSIYE